MDSIERIARGLPGPVRRALRPLKRLIAGRSPAAKSSQAYWTGVNVTEHHRFRSAQESLQYLRWRNAIYLDYGELMPVGGVDGKVVLDYGCGPGHDVIGFGTQSRPARLIGMDVSPTSLAEARERASLHGFAVEFVRIDENDVRLPLEDASIDVIHSSGVLHHTPDPVRIMGEFRRVLKPGGYVQVMVYNHDSIFLHLLVGYLKRVLEPGFEGLSRRQVFTRSTDGPGCPISECYRPAEWIALCARAGFDASYRGAAISTMEMSILNRRFDAIHDRRLDEDSREFLLALRFDDRGVPRFQGHTAGIDACYELRMP
ncbi:MAG: class I SAM-dependent methyltransferase [Gammaproteobacteria bacterium]